jgi:hypothetical protein
MRFRLLHLLDGAAAPDEGRDEDLIEARQTWQAGPRERLSAPGVKPDVRAGLAVGLLSTFLATACGPRIDLSTGLHVDAVSTGWLDAGLVDGKKKLVPAVSFRLKNASDQKLAMLEVNARFRRVGDESEWGGGFVTAAGSGGLAPGAATSAITIRSQLGYTGVESGAEMLDNSHFVDARVDLFAKYGSATWTRLGEYRVARRLISR